MTFKITQYAWFLWFDEQGNDLFDERDILFTAIADGNETTTFVRLDGATYDIEVEGVDLAVLNGQLSDGTAHTFTVFDAATGIKLVEFSGMNLDVAEFLDDYENDVDYPDDPNAPPPPGSIFDASRVAAQPDGSGIGGYGTNDGDDTLYGSQGTDQLFGFAGHDRMLGNAGNDKLWGDEGRDTLLGGAGNDTVVGGLGNDSLAGDGGADVVDGLDGRDTVVGGNGNDFLYGGAGNDKVFGGKGKDFLIGDQGKDTLDGGAGRDWIGVSASQPDPVALNIDLAGGTIKSALGTDTLISIENAAGEDFRDSIKGNSGANALLGYGGKDTIDGGAGNDTIWGGLGRDKVTGGTGKDSFFFWEYGIDYYDQIVDFKHGEDKILLAHDPFFELALGQLKSSNFVLGTKAKDSDDFVIYDKKTGKLYYDADAEGGYDADLIATFASKPTLSASDFKIVVATSFESFWLV